MKRKRRQVKIKNEFKKRAVQEHVPFLGKPLEVKAEEVGGDTKKLIKKFCKKVRREEVLKPYYDKLMHFTPKSQLKRQKKLSAIYFQKKKRIKEENL